MALPSLPLLLRRVGLSVWFLAFYWLLFFFLPSVSIEWNAELGWPVLRSGPTRILGALMVVCGVGVLAHCTGLFAFVGRGTPVPVAPPEKLVIGGLYRYSRNPIYVANVAVWLGMFLWAGHLALLLLTVTGIIVTELVIVLSEEPGLRRRFGRDYEDYCARVPRWLPFRWTSHQESASRGQARIPIEGSADRPPPPPAVPAMDPGHRARAERPADYVDEEGT